MAALRVFLPKSNSLLIGVCLPCLRHDACKIKVQKHEFDQMLVKYFKKKFEFYAYDPNKICKSGDTVLIEEWPETTNSLITHKVVEVVYSLGDMTDPITGKKIVGTRFRDDLEELDTIFGKSESMFQYEKAPKRGWQQNIRDFSHREHYRKYHEFDKGDENENQPYSIV